MEEAKRLGRNALSQVDSDPKDHEQNRQTDAALQVQDHGYTGRERNQNEGTQTCEMPLAGTLAAGDGGQDDGGYKAEQDGIGSKAAHRAGFQRGERLFAAIFTSMRNRRSPLG